MKYLPSSVDVAIERVICPATLHQTNISKELIKLGSLVIYTVKMPSQCDCCLFYVSENTRPYGGHCTSPLVIGDSGKFICKRKSVGVWQSSFS